MTQVRSGRCVAKWLVRCAVAMLAVTTAVTGSACGDGARHGGHVGRHRSPEPFAITVDEYVRRFNDLQRSPALGGVARETLVAAEQGGRLFGCGVTADAWVFLVAPTRGDRVESMVVRVVGNHGSIASLAPLLVSTTVALLGYAHAPDVARQVSGTVVPKLDATTDNPATVPIGRYAEVHMVEIDPIRVAFVVTPVGGTVPAQVQSLPE